MRNLPKAGDSVQFIHSVMSIFDPETAAHQASLFITNSYSLLKLKSIKSVMQFKHLILCRSLLLLPASFPASGSIPISQLFTSGSQNIGVSASASVLPMNIQGWFPLGWTGWNPCSSRDPQESTVFQHHSSKASILQHSAFFIVQLSHPYMTIRKTIALTRWTFVGKVVSLLFNVGSRLVIAFLPRSKCLLISRLQSPSAVILEPKKIKPVTVSFVSPSICYDTSTKNTCRWISLLHYS